MENMDRNLALGIFIQYNSRLKKADIQNYA